MANKVSDEIKQKVRECKQGNPTFTNPDLGKMFGLNKSTVSAILNERPENGQVSPEAPVSTLAETSEINEKGWAISLPQTNISTIEGLVEHCKIDLTIWEIDRWVCNQWAVGAKNDEGKIEVTPLFQVKAFLKRKQNVVDAKAEIEAIKADAKLDMPFPRPVVYTTQDSANLYEFLCPDLHLAKLAWGRETGFTNYDAEMAVETYRRAVDDHIQGMSGRNVSRIVVGVGNDLLQADNIQGTTYAGTKVDVDSRYRKTYVTARKMLTEAIEKFRLIAPVDVKVVPGNHDVQSAFTLGDSLECRFHNYTDVSVDNNPEMHKIVEWGDVFLILLHGHLGKQADYGVWMATRYSEIFGRTRFRELHCGHKHKLLLDEKFGIRTRIFGSLSGTDSWHSDNMFTGNLRVAEGLLWNKTRGLTDQHFYTEMN